MGKKRKTDSGLRHRQRCPGIVTNGLDGRQYALIVESVVQKGFIPSIDDQRVICQFTERDISFNTEIIDVADRNK